MIEQTYIYNTCIQYLPIPVYDKHKFDRQIKFIRYK